MLCIQYCNFDCIPATWVTLACFRWRVATGSLFTRTWNQGRTVGPPTILRRRKIDDIFWLYFGLTRSNGALKSPRMRLRDLWQSPTMGYIIRIDRFFSMLTECSGLLKYRASSFLLAVHLFLESSLGVPCILSQTGPGNHKCSISIVTWSTGAALFRGYGGMRF